MKEKLLVELLQRLKEKIYVYPHILAFIPLAVDLLEKGFEETIRKYKYILEGGLSQIQKCEYIITREIRKKNINTLILKLDMCITNPDLRLNLINYTFGAYSIDNICSFLSANDRQCTNIKRQMEILKQEYSLLGDLFYQPVKSYLDLAVFLNIPLHELVITKELMKRSKWLSDIVVNDNNLIILGPSFIGKSTHLFMACYILLKKYGLQLVTGTYPRRIPGNSIYIGDDLGLAELKQLQGKRYMVTINPEDVKLLDKIIPGEKIVLGSEDFGKPVNFRNKTVVLVLNDQLYSPSEVRDITGEKLLDRTDSLKILHIRQYIAKNRLREEYDNVADLLRRLITRYYYIRKFAPLIGFITAVYGFYNVTTLKMITLLSKYRNAYGDPSLLLGNISRELLTIPHKSWIQSLAQLYEDKDLRGIFEEINSFREDIYSIRKSIVFKTEDPHEKLVLATNYPELMVEAIGKDSIRMIHVSPIHFLEASKNPFIQEIKRKITTSKDISRSVYQLILFLLKNKIKVDYVDLIRKYNIPKKLAKKLFLIIKSREYDITELIRLYNKEKDRVIKEILVEQISDKVAFTKQIVHLLDFLFRIDSYKLKQKLLYLFGKYSELHGLLEKKKSLNKHEEIRLYYLSGKLDKIMAKGDPISEYYRANTFLRIGDLDRALLSINRAYIGSYNRLINGELNYAYIYIYSLYKLIITNLLKKKFKEASVLIDQFYEDINSYGHIIYPNKLRSLLMTINSLREVNRKQTCTNNYLYCLKASVLVNNKKVFQKYITYLIKNMDDLELPEILELGHIIRRGLIKKWINPELAEKYLNYIEKYKYIDYPRFKYVYLSIIPVYLLRKRNSVDKKYLELDSEYEQLIRDYNIWAENIYANYLYIKAVYYVKKGRNPGQAAQYFRKALKLLENIKSISRKVYDRRKNILELWINISEIMNSSYSTCYESLKNIISRKLPLKTSINAKYWYIRCLMGNKMYRTALEKTSETLMMVRDPNIKFRLMILSYIISAKINRILADKRLDDLINYLYDRIRRERITLSDAIKNLTRLIIEQWKNAELYGLDRSVNALTNLLRLADRDSIIHNLQNLKKIIAILSELNKLEYIDRILSRIINIVRDVKLTLLYIDTLLMNNRYEEAEKQLEKISDMINKPLKQAYEALIMYYKGKLDKARKKAQKIVGKVDKLDLKAKLLYIIGRSYEAKGEMDKAYKVFKELLSICEKNKHIPLVIIGDSYYVIAEYYQVNRSYYSALDNYGSALRIYDRIVFENNRYEHIARIIDTLQSIMYIASNSKDPMVRGEAINIVCTYVHDRYKEISGRGLTNIFTHILHSCKMRS